MKLKKKDKLFIYFDFIKVINNKYLLINKAQA